MRVLLIHNEPVLAETHPEADSEREILDAAAVIADHLQQAGLEVARQGVGRELAAFRATLRQARPDVVFNLFEGLGDDPASEVELVRILEEEQVAFTGCSSDALWHAGRKDIAKRLFQQAGLPTPAFMLVEDLSVIDCPLTFPVIVKPAFRDASIGIDQASVVRDSISLQRQVQRVAERYGLPILVEECVQGRELSVVVIDRPCLQVLPIVEVLFQGPGWPIVCYTAKWRQDSREYADTPLRYPVALPPPLGQRLDQVAKEAFRVLGCRDVVNMDFRLTADGVPHVLEVNPNPDLCATPCLVESLRAVGLTYPQFLLQLVDSARRRGGEQP